MYTIEFPLKKDTKENVPIREVSSFQRVKCTLIFVKLGPFRGILSILYE